MFLSSAGQGEDVRRTSQTNMICEKRAARLPIASPLFFYPPAFCTMDLWELVPCFSGGRACSKGS